MLIDWRILAICLSMKNSKGRIDLGSTLGLVSEGLIDDRVDLAKVIIHTHCRCMIKIFRGQGW